MIEHGKYTLRDKDKESSKRKVTFEQEESLRTIEKHTDSIDENCA